MTGGGVIELSEIDARTCVYLLGALARDRRRAGHPVPREVDALQRRLEHRIVTRSRQRVEVVDRQLNAMDRVGTKWTADRLSWSRSKVLRNADWLDGEIVGGAYMFPRSTVENIARQQERTQR